MMQFDRISLGRQAKELGFVRDTFEKVCRLEDVLSFVENDALLSDTLALKGGTAINLKSIPALWSHRVRTRCSTRSFPSPSWFRRSFT